jgi:hypothetical protein
MKKQIEEILEGGVILGEGIFGIWKVIQGTFLLEI